MCAGNVCAGNVASVAIGPLSVGPAEISKAIFLSLKNARPGLRSCSQKSTRCVFLVSHEIIIRQKTFN